MEFFTQKWYNHGKNEGITMSEKKYFGVMMNVSQAVMKPSKVKEFALYIKKLGYNMLQLYTEDTYEVNGEEYFGYLRGGYTKGELKDIVSYCESIGIEVIPCVEVLAHLSTLFKWQDYAEINDSDDILLVGEERTYALIENIFATLRECFTSDRVNIGLDEAHNLGLGQYLQRHGYTDKSEIFFSHIEKVTAIAEKYGFIPMMWSDMLFKNLYGSYYTAKDDGKISEVKNLLPDNLSLVYWEYFFYRPEQYESMIKLHKDFDKEVWFAAAVHNYIGAAPSNDMSDDSLRAAITACRRQNIDHFIITLWGGSECSHFLTLPSLCYARCVFEGQEDKETIRKRFYEATGENYDAIRALDAPNTLAASYLELPEIDFCRYVLYQDVFSGYFDTVLKEGSCERYDEKADELLQMKKHSRFGYLFEAEAALLRAMYIKHDLGLQLRRAYKAGDRTALMKLREKITAAAQAVKEFHTAATVVWKTENNPQGMEINDIKLGGLICRLKNCAQMLGEYLNGETDSIPELSAELKSFNAVRTNYLFWSRITTVNRFD